jgi:hypothetical protein
MKTTSTTTPNRDFTSISPSAKWILLLKAHTKIPYALEAAKVIDPKFTPDFNKDIRFWGITFHFENRYWSIDQLMKDLNAINFLELSSGFSFRGLDLTQQKKVHYIDTDLPEMVETKKEITAALQGDNKNTKGVLEVLPLNALDEHAFNNIINRLPPGEVVIMNEGLLMYLELEEKKRLCAIIHQILQERGGYWITGDIYLKLKSRNIQLQLDEKIEKFFEEQQIEEKKFESFAGAEKFFNEMGFVKDKEAEVDPKSLASFPYLIKHATPEMVEKMGGMERVHAVWRLKVGG